jgi:putative ABC transport system substrate-binding protein
MKRRELMLLIGGAATAWPPAARAQQKAMPVIGFLGATSSGANAPNVAAFRQGVSEAGYIEGKNVAIEYRWAEGRYDELPALAAELVGRNVDVIATSGGPPPALAAKSVTSTVPIVFVSGDDPIGKGLVTSLARPSGNLTGVSLMGVEVTPKRLQLLSELVPQASVVALLVNPNNANAERIMRDVLEAARARGGEAPYPEGQHRRRDRRRFRNPRPTAYRRAPRRQRFIFQQPARPARCAGGPPCRSSDLRMARIRRGRRPD